MVLQYVKIRLVRGYRISSDNPSRRIVAPRSTFIRSDCPAIVTYSSHQRAFCNLTLLPLTWLMSSSLKFSSNSSSLLVGVGGVLGFSGRCSGSRDGWRTGLLSWRRVGGRDRWRSGDLRERRAGGDPNRLFVPWPQSLPPCVSALGDPRRFRLPGSSPSSPRPEDLPVSLPSSFFNISDAGPLLRTCTCKTENPSNVIKRVTYRGTLYGGFAVIKIVWNDNICSLKNLESLAKL